MGSLTLQNDASIRVELNIDQSKAALVGEHSRASLGQVGLIGDSYVGSSPDPEGDGLPAGSRLPFQPQPSVQDLIQQVRQPLKTPPSSRQARAKSTRASLICAPR